MAMAPVGRYRGRRSVRRGGAVAAGAALRFARRVAPATTSRPPSRPCDAARPATRCPRVAEAATRNVPEAKGLSVKLLQRPANPRLERLAGLTSTAMQSQLT